MNGVSGKQQWQRVTSDQIFSPDPGGMLGHFKFHPSIPVCLYSKSLLYLQSWSWSLGQGCWERANIDAGCLVLPAGCGIKSPALLMRAMGGPWPAPLGTSLAGPSLWSAVWEVARASASFRKEEPISKERTNAGLLAANPFLFFQAATPWPGPQLTLLGTPGPERVRH